MKIKITRKNRNLGWGYTTAVMQTRIGLTVEPTEKPYHTGTVGTIYQKMDADRTFASIKSGGTCYSTGWFFKVSGEWKKIDLDYSHPGDLLTNYDGEYLTNEIEVKVND